MLAEEGIDVDHIDVPDLDTFQRALHRAIERHNMARFTSAARARELAVTTLQLVIEAITEDNTTLAGQLLGEVQPDLPDNSTATVASCTGIALGLLDD